MTIKIVTDTGSDIPPDLLADYDIHQVPLILRFGDRAVLDLSLIHISEPTRPY